MVFSIVGRELVGWMFRSCRSRYVCRCCTTIHLFFTPSSAMVRMAWCVDGQWTGPTTFSPSGWESGGRRGPHPRPVACWVGPLSKPTEPSWVGGGRGRLEGDPEGGTGRPHSLAMGVLHADRMGVLVGRTGDVGTNAVEERRRSPWKVGDISSAGQVHGRRKRRTIEGVDGR